MWATWENMRTLNRAPHKGNIHLLKRGGRKHHTLWIPLINKKERETHEGKVARGCKRPATGLEDSLPATQWLDQ